MPQQPGDKIPQSWTQEKILSLVEPRIKTLIRRAFAGGLGGATDHGSLSGLADNDHTQYVNAAGSGLSLAAQALSLDITGLSTATPVITDELPFFDVGVGNRKMTIASMVGILSLTDLGTIDHGALTGRADDDHSAYMLVAPTLNDNELMRADGTSGRLIHGSDGNQFWTLDDANILAAPPNGGGQFTLNFGQLNLDDGVGGEHISVSAGTIFFTASGGIGLIVGRTFTQFSGELILDGNRIILESVSGVSFIEAASDDVITIGTGGVIRQTLTNTLASFAIPIAMGGAQIDTEGGALLTGTGTIDTENGIIQSGGGIIQSEGGIIRSGTGAGTGGGVIDSEGGIIDSRGGIIRSGGGIIDSEGGVIQSGGVNIDTEGGDLDTGGGDLLLGSSPGTGAGVIDYKTDGNWTIRPASFGYIFKALGFDVFETTFNTCRGLLGGITFGGNGLCTYELNAAGTTKIDGAGGATSIRFQILGSAAGQFELISGDPTFTAPSSVLTPGNTLILKAGNTSNTVGGTLRLRGGTGTGSGGPVKLEDSAGNEKARADAAGFIVDSRLDINNPIALGVGGNAALGAIGSSGPTTQAQAQWVEIDINGTPHWIAVWT